MQPPDQSQQPEESMLEFRGDINVWQGETRYFLVRLKDDTLRRYMAAWLETRGITKPTEVQTHEAFVHCRKLSYWENVKGDKDVQMIRFPKPSEQR